MKRFRTAFSKNGQPTITRKNDYNGILGGGVNGGDATSSDIRQIKAMYNCGGTVNPPPPPPPATRNKPLFTSLTDNSLLKKIKKYHSEPLKKFIFEQPKISENNC